MAEPSTVDSDHDDARWTTIRAQLAAAVRHGQHAQARALREELNMITLRRRGRAIAAELPPPDAEKVRFVADVFGLVVTTPEGDAAE